MGFLVNLVGQASQLVPGKDAIFIEGVGLKDSLFELKDQLYRVATNRVVVYAATGYVAFRIWGFLFSPLEHIRRNPDVGYINYDRQHKLERANDVRRRRQTGDLPPVYPNGWYCVMPAHELPLNGGLG